MAQRRQRILKQILAELDQGTMLSDEELQEKFLYLAAQFKPIRCNVRLKFSESFVTMDSYSYMDKNASLSEVSQARLESGDVMDGSVIM